jgi:hypothetical protein
MEDTIVPPFPTPYIFQLSRVIQATSLAARYSGNALQSSFANAAYAGVRNYAYNGHIYNGLTPGGGSIRFFDDNAWTGQMFVQLYHQTGEAKFLDAAKQELTFERTGQVKGGGLIWNTGTTKISAGSTGGAIKLALQLYEIDKGSSRLSFARYNYHWMRQTLLQSNNLYLDSITASGQLEGTTSPAHQSFMIDSGRLMTMATGNQTYANQALQTAEASIKRFDSRTWNNFSPAQFAEWYSSLQRLDSVVTNAAYSLDWTASFHTYLDHIRNVINTTTGKMPWPNSEEASLIQSGASWILTIRAGM